MDQSDFNCLPSSTQWKGNLPKSEVTRCYGCEKEIKDKHILHVAPDLKWHASCLKCTECDKQLDETCTCFVRDKKPFCKTDYIELFGTKCAKCHRLFDSTDFVMRIHDHVYHKGCFQCSVCSMVLLPGHKFSCQNNNLYCKIHLKNSSLDKKYRTKTDVVWHQSEQNNLASMNSEKPSFPLSVHHYSPNTKHKKDKKDKMKTTRIRTVLNEKQLQMLRSCYAANPRPDALMKEQLVELTGLSPRVIRVWFQNKRCKDKKRQIAASQPEQDEKCGTTMGNKRSGLFQDSEMPYSHSAQNRSLIQGTSDWQLDPSLQFHSGTSLSDERFGFEQDVGYHNRRQETAAFPYSNYHSCFIAYSASSPCDGEINSVSPQFFNSDLSSPTCSE